MPQSQGLALPYSGTTMWGRFDGHHRDFVGIRKQDGMLVLVRNVFGGAAEDPPVVGFAERLRAVGVRGPIDLAVDEVDAAGFEP